MHALVVATVWIGFAAAITSAVLIGISMSIMMKATATDAEKAHAKKLEMIGFWMLIVALIMLFIAAVAASCQPSLGKLWHQIRDRVAANRALASAMPLA